MLFVNYSIHFAFIFSQGLEHLLIDCLSRGSLQKKMVNQIQVCKINHRQVLCLVIIQACIASWRMVPRLWLDNKNMKNFKFNSQSRLREIYDQCSNFKLSFSLNKWESNYCSWEICDWLGFGICEQWEELCHYQVRSKLQNLSTWWWMTVDLIATWECC